MTPNTEDREKRIFRILNGEASAEELQEFAVWLREPENEILFSQLKKVWNFTSGPRLSSGQLEKQEKQFRKFMKMRMGGG